MDKQELVNTMKQFLRRVFIESDLTIGENRAMRHHLEDFMSVSKPVTQSEQFVKLVNKAGDTMVIRVSSIQCMEIQDNTTTLYLIGYGIELDTEDNRDILDHLLEVLKG